jgi:ABC-type branched-subunit amino acid transport system permease subunit
VVWGLYNACLLLLWRVVRLRSILLTFLLAAVGWVVFRSASMTEAVDYFSTLVSQLSTLHLGSIAHGKQALLWCLLLVVIEWLQYFRLHGLSQWRNSGKGRAVVTVKENGKVICDTTDFDAD